MTAGASGRGEFVIVTASDYDATCLTGGFATMGLSLFSGIERSEALPAAEEVMTVVMRPERVSPT